MHVQIDSLVIYPLKSLAGVACESMEFDALGARHDRRYMLVDASGKFVSQRTCPIMALASVADAGESWCIKTPDNNKLLLPKAGHCSKPVPVNVWSDTFSAWEQPKELSIWFSEWLGLPVRLVYIGAAAQRPVDPDYAPAPCHVGFADGFPLLLTHTTSLKALNLELPFTIGMERFRPNIVVSGGDAWAEDHWRRLNTADGSQSLLSVKPCSRCAIPTIDPATAERQKVVWQVLKKLRTGSDGQVYFGHNLLHLSDHPLQVGQTLSVNACD
ncbi:putative protein YcbX [BD1-7 clade bacterium]|uniref:MOSC domain-containing protein n=1 Tax=BD1-7 clade bacterium TaxID=2029982 RepID=A0A5S9PRF9_9GAMM|nr:putative protein YcbX [BD1-7 clade bacterium]